MFVNNGDLTTGSVPIVGKAGHSGIIFNLTNKDFSYLYKVKKKLKRKKEKAAITSQLPSHPRFR